MLRKKIIYNEEGGIYQQYMVDECGQKQLAFIEYHPNGTVAEQTYYKDNKKNGLSQLFYQTGQLKKQVFYKMGAKMGTYLSFFITGMKCEIAEYKDNQLHGYYALYHENGPIKRRAKYKDGCQMGPMYTYDTNGQLIEKSIIENGKNLIIFTQNPPPLISTNQQILRYNKKIDPDRAPTNHAIIQARKSGDKKHARYIANVYHQQLHPVLQVKRRTALQLMK